MRYAAYLIWLILLTLDWVSASETGCCYSATGDTICDTTDKDTCEILARLYACEWKAGEDADCAVTTPEPGCCYSQDGNSDCDTDDRGTCDKLAGRQGCEWITGRDADCS